MIMDSEYPENYNYPNYLHVSDPLRGHRIVRHIRTRILPAPERFAFCAATTCSDLRHMPN
jgi:hypothetical protein